MAPLQETYNGLDPLTLSAIVEIQLEDSAALAVSSKGKHREGTIKDADVALQILTADLRACQRVLEDRNMARSMALAVHRDGELISRAHQQEDQIARDRQMAANLLQAPDSDMESYQHENEVIQDPWVDDEMLEKAAALYNEDLMSIVPDLISRERDDDENDDENDISGRPESSASGKRRIGRTEKRLGHCIACRENKDFSDVARMPCEHEYCRECLISLFRASMKDESLFPPRCDGQPIPLDQFRSFLPVDLVKKFEEKSVELSTKNRVYCHDHRCSTFIPWPASADRTDGGWLTCPRCEKTTCTTCKATAHTGDCPDDTAVQQLLDTAGNEQWQRCYECHRFVELEQGCNHMTCYCGAEFCYICGMQWKTCPCDQWEEPRLYARAAQIMQREPNPRRRLFEPARTAIPQPRTRQPSRAASAAPDLGMPSRSSSPASVWESDFSDHSEWEQDWPGADDDEALILLSAPQSPSLEPTTPHPDSNDSPTTPTSVNQLGSPAAEVVASSNNRDINAVMDRLREDHECVHDEWHRVNGPHRCEECHDRLDSYVFECKLCMLQACNRCHRNRLR